LHCIFTVVCIKAATRLDNIWPMAYVPKRPVLLFSMDSEDFSAPPTATGGLKAFYRQYGKRYHETDIQLVHFLTADEITPWKDKWLSQHHPQFVEAVKQGLNPVVGFSFYTWNAAEFLDLIVFIKKSLPSITVIAGGPHVQQPEDYLFDDPIDLIILGEGEASFQEVMDSESMEQWPAIDGLAYLNLASELITTNPRKREIELDKLPSALEVIDLCDAEGKPLYSSIAYETSRGCPFKCAFCEWGTGALGTKMYQYSLERVKKDWDYIVASGIENIWLADSNFGALKEDLFKAQYIVELKNNTGLPKTFATSWSKKHSPRVQEIVLLLNENGLLPHYQLALQTLTPLALELSNRSNMSANKYEPIAKEMSEQGVPIAAELIWGLPGDNLRDFETNLDQLLKTFPNINIFGYTLLPGTEFYRKRKEYRIESIPVAGYGKAKGEYVIGCHTFARAEGIEGYYLITSHIILNRGWIVPLTMRYLSLQGEIRVAQLLRHILADLLANFKPELVRINIYDKMDTYEARALIYLQLIAHLQKCYDVIRDSLVAGLRQQGAGSTLIATALKLLQIDEALCPRTGNQKHFTANFSFNAPGVLRKLEAMELPDSSFFDSVPHSMEIKIPGGVGEYLLDPDGGSWMKGEVICTSTADSHTHSDVYSEVLPEPLLFSA